MYFRSFSPMSSIISLIRLIFFIIFTLLIDFGFLYYALISFVNEGYNLAFEIFSASSLSFIDAFMQLYSNYFKHDCIYPSTFIELVCSLKCPHHFFNIISII